MITVTIIIAISRGSCFCRNHSLTNFIGWRILSSFWKWFSFWFWFTFSFTH